MKKITFLIPESTVDEAKEIAKEKGYKLYYLYNLALQIGLDVIKETKNQKP
jgi:hypothetical protein